MSILYFVLISLIVIMLVFSMLFYSYQRKIMQISFNNTLTSSLEVVDNDSEQVSVYWDSPEIVSSSLVEDTGIN